MISDELSNMGMDNKKIRYLISYDEDFVSDVLGALSANVDELSRRDFLKGAGAAAMAGAAGSAMAMVSPKSGADKQDLGNGFVKTKVEAGGYEVDAVLDTESGTYFFLNKKPDGEGGIFRTPARYLVKKDG